MLPFHPHFPPKEPPSPLHSPWQILEGPIAEAQNSMTYWRSSNATQEEANRLWGIFQDVTSSPPPLKLQQIQSIIFNKTLWTQPLSYQYAAIYRVLLEEQEALKDAGDFKEIAAHIGIHAGLKIEQIETTQKQLKWALQTYKMRTKSPFLSEQLLAAFEAHILQRLPVPLQKEMAIFLRAILIEEGKKSHERTTQPLFAWNGYQEISPPYIRQILAEARLETGLSNLLVAGQLFDHLCTALQDPLPNPSSDQVALTPPLPVESAPPIEIEETPLPSPRNISVLSTPWANWPSKKPIPLSYYQSLVYRSLIERQEDIPPQASLKKIAKAIAPHPALRGSNAVQIHALFKKIAAGARQINQPSDSSFGLSDVIKALEETLSKNVQEPFQEGMPGFLKAVILEEQKRVNYRKMKNLWGEPNLYNNAHYRYVRQFLKVKQGVSVSFLLEKGLLYETFSYALQK
ncbi:MAG: hypothetical protein K0S07_63 [Chlamydiales bacterium]|jgi:hypothetical protein|nr:hypothetical protein [Chlamydiales bacterium]